MEGNNTRKLYDALKSDGYTDLGDFSSFEGKLKDSGKREMLYDVLKKDGWQDLGDFSQFESKLGYAPINNENIKETDYVSQSSVNPPPISLRQEVDIPKSDQSEYVNPWTNSPDYNFESLRKKGKIETATPPPPTEYEKDSSFMNTWAGDAIQKLNAGGADLGAGIFGVLDKASKGLESATGGLISHGGAFKDISDRFKADAEFSRARSNRYNGKDFTDLWKEGNYMGAIGDIALQGVESLPMSIGAMAATMAGAPAAGLAGIGSIVASQKYDDLDQNNPNMGEFAKVSNAILTGTAESLSEMLGAGVSKAWMSTLFKTLGKEKAQEAIKRGIMGKMQEFYKKFGMFFEPVNEGIEEVSSTLAENITDKITGADPERDLTDGVLQSFVYGMGGGAYFTGAGALAKGAQYAADKIGGKQSQQPITDSNVIDQGVNTPPQFTQSRFAEAEEQGRNMTDPGDIRMTNQKMEETRASLSEMAPGLASTIESYVDDGASEAQIMSLLDGVNADARPLAEDFYADYLRISGLQDRIDEEIDNEVETYVANNITPYVTTNPDGQSIVTTATLSEGNEERPVYVRSIEGDKAVISDNGQDRMVSVKRLGDIIEQDASQMETDYRDQLISTRQSEIDMAMNHNPKTQSPKPGLVIWNGDNAFILQGQDENGDWIAQPAAYDRETGQVTAKNGSSPAIPITENEILNLQDAVYDAQQANEVPQDIDNVTSIDANMTSVPTTEDTINQPTSEIVTENAIDQTMRPSNVEVPSMVMREDGTPDFVSSGMDNTLDFLHDKYGEKMPKKIEVTRKAFDEDLKKASEKLDKAQEAYDDAPIGKEDKVEAALIKARQEYDAIKVEADFWANLDDDIKEASKRPGDVIAKEISVMGDPMSGEELAAMMLANGAIKLTRDSYKKETGAGDNETSRMFGLFASPEKGGVNIERAGEILELADKENGTNFFDENDTNAGRDAVIEVLSSARTRGDLIDYVKRNREAIAERERQAEYNAYAEWCEENYHMSPEEYEAYEESIIRDFSEKQLTDEERGELDSQIVDEIQAIIDEQNEIDAILAQNKPIENENVEGNDESGGDGLREGGGEVLPREQLDQTGGTGETETGEQVGAGIDRPDGATQEGASGEVRPIGKGFFGNIYDQFKGKVKEAFDFLVNHKEGDLLGVFHRDGIGSIDLVWGNDNGGLKHIIKRHIEEQNDFSDVSEIQSAINDAISNGDIVRGNEDKIVLQTDRYKVSINKQYRDENGNVIERKNWIVTAFDKAKKKGEKKNTPSRETLTTPSSNLNKADGVTLPSNGGIFTDKGSISSSENQANEAKSFVAPSPKENENLLDYAERIVEAKRLHDEERKVDTNPSEAQKEAGNYKKGHIKINGFDVTIEQPAGSVRSGKDANGKEWSVTMNNTYGYIRGTEGVDGDHIDVFLGPDMSSDMVYVVDQVNTDGSFDEHKIMMGFPSLEDARSAYLSNYEEGWQGLGNITGVTLDEFKKWIDSSTRKTKPFDKYKGIKREENVVPRKVKKLSLVDKDDYITSAERKHIKAFLESGLKEARVNNSTYEISNIGDDGVYEIVRRFNYTDPLTLVKDENGKLVNKRGEGEHVIRVKPTFEETRPDGGIRFREVKDKNGEKSLVGLHNISEEKLRKALRQGGFANPSAAVIDISRQSHTGYGAISLVLPSSMIEKRTGKNAGTWSQDAWTPTYPTIERQFSGKGSDAFSNDLHKLPEEMQPTTKSGMDSYMDGRREESLAYMYLYEQGKAPEIARTKPSYPEKTRTEVEDVTNGSFSMRDLSDEQLSRLKDAYMEYKGFSKEGYNEAIKLRRTKLEEAIEKMNPRSILYEKRKTDLERIDKYGFDYSAVESFMKSVRDDISNSGKVDSYGTIRDSWNFIEENGMRGDFNKWLDKLNDRYGIKEIIFNGFTPSGIRKYIPNTLENVSNFMKKQGKNASVGIGASFQNFAASLLDAKGSLKDIRKDKGKLTTDHADVDAFRDKWSKVFYELGGKLQPDAKGYDDYGLYRLAEAARSKDPQKYIKKEYGIDFSDNDVKDLNEMVDAIRNEYPAMYFETKFERPVYLEEFAAAVVPDNVDDGIRKAIGDAGLSVFTYKDGDETSRNEAVKQASEIGGVRFRSIEEEITSGLDKTESIESTINDWSNKLNTPVRVIHDVDDITDTDENMLARKRDSKGWYDTSTGEIVIVSPNSTSVGDAQRTFLHEVVGHHGLRELFGDDFDTFLDNVYRNANEDIRKNIIDRTKGNPLNLREATEEYLAELAERGFDNKAERSLWEKIKDAFIDMLRKAGISLDFKLSDKDLRYILWRSYRNLEQGNLMDVAEDIVMRNELGIDNINLNGNGSIERDIEPEKGKQPSETKGTGRELETIEGVNENRNESKRDDVNEPRGAEKAFDGTEDTVDRDGRAVNDQVDNNGNQLDGGDTGDRNGSVRDGIGGERAFSGREGLENKGRSAGEGIREKTDDFSFAERTLRFREDARNESVLFADNDVQVVEKQVGSAKDQYERTLSTSSYQFQEAFQDSMLGLKTLQGAVAKATKSRILDYENAYMAENAISSINEAEFNAYRKAAFGPILKAMSRLEKMGSTIDEIRDYLITKHGIERNREMAVKRALSQNTETYKSLLEEYIGRRNEIRENGRSWEEQQSEMDRLAEEYGANLSDDFSGFTSMYPNEDNTGYDPDSARRYVLDYESRYHTSELSASVKRATDAILAKQRDSGLMSQNTFDSISDMYQFYVPLRGWEETTADEVYAYLTSESQTFNAPIKTVVGRKSKADDPIATIANMAESGIMQGNRNLMKQKFLTMVQNHKTDLVSVSEMWVRLDEASGDWIAVFPDIPSSANPEQVESIVESFNKRMEELSNEKGSNVRRSRDAIGIPYKILPKDLKEHQVIVKRAGKEYVLTINGNPRAAQALNGLTNPDNTKGWFGTVERYAGWLNRNLAANFTTRNPNFMVSNFLRDALYSNTTVWVKESPVYAWKFNKNFAMVNPIKMYRLVKGYENGTLDMSDPLNKAYHDFVMRGGETGYTNLRDVEAKKKAIQKELQYSKRKVSIGKALKVLGEWMDLFNKSVENCARFAAFLTSREMGRSMDKSIYDAKEISVNFNKKGAGSKFLNTEGQTAIGNASAFTSGLSRSMYVFWNAGVQGMYNFGRLAKNNPKKFLGLASSFYLLGTIMPMIAAAFGDDDDDYYDLPEYVRRNNICFRNGGGNWITIPMPIELRAIYGLGEMSSGVVTGKEKYTDRKMAMKIAEQMSQVLPLDMMEGGGGFSAFVPSSVKPLIEAGDNKDWTGLPLYKDNDFNKGMPEWTKAFKSVDPAILEMTKYANKLTGGDKYTTGAVNLNPAIIEHILDGYFGGIEATRAQLVKSAETAWGSRDFDWRNIPVGNRLIKSGDERTKKKAIDNAYYENLEEMEKIGQRLRGYRKELSNPQNDSFDMAEYQKKLNDLMMSDEYRGYVEFNNLNKLYQSMGEYLKKVDDERLERELYDLKAMMNEIANSK